MIPRSEADVVAGGLRANRAPDSRDGQGRRSRSRRRARSDAPILIVQGTADAIVAPDVTERLAAKLCKNGERIELRLYPGVAHLVTGHEAAPAVLRWVADRFAGKPSATTCT
ncbi:MAG: hypothetical protein QOD48_707 [Gaiellaceae bacterium]|nr:hypothetical protein [Gaiellaceae bacterium]